MEKLNNLEIGARIRGQREALHITREKLAEHLDVSTKFVSDIELGIRGMSTLTLAKLSETLRISTDYILFGKQEKADLSQVLAALALCPPEKMDYAEQLLALFIRAIAK